MDKVSFVFQDTFLFKQSILDNIRMGNPNATEEQVIAAAKAARCHEFIEQLPNGYSFSGSLNAVASSRTIMGASFTIALAMAIRWRSPPERWTRQLRSATRRTST